MTGLEEQELIFHTFAHTIQKISNRKRIAIYGLGKNTEFILANDPQKRIVALMDEKKAGSIQWGLPVISTDEAVGMIDIIIVVARNDVVPIIYSRIKGLKAKGIDILDAAGRIIGEQWYKPYPKRLYASIHTTGDEITDTLLKQKINKNGTCLIHNKWQLGYTLYGPLLVGYFGWLFKILEERVYDGIAFLARDGYLPKQIYHILVNHYNIKHAPPGYYTASSRRLLAGAAVTSKEELLRQIRTFPHDTEAGKILQIRFGVQPRADDNLSKEKIEDLDDAPGYYLSYYPQILEASQKERTNFFAYLDKLDILYRSDNILLFDSLTTGTSADFWRKLTGTQARLAAMCLLGIPDYSVYDRTLDKAFFGNDCSFFKMKAYTRAEFLNDSVLSAPTSQIICIDKNGVIVFSKQGKDYYPTIEQIHLGAIQFCKDYMKLVDWSDFIKQAISTDYLDTLQGMILEKTIPVLPDAINGLHTVEQFSGRMGKISVTN